MSNHLIYCLDPVIKHAAKVIILAWGGRKLHLHEDVGFVTLSQSELDFGPRYFLGFWLHTKFHGAFLIGALEVFYDSSRVEFKSTLLLHEPFVFLQKISFENRSTFLSRYR